MPKKIVEDVAVTGKRVLVRVDFNVPMDKNGAISDDTRIRACLPTIQYLIEKHARVIICSHLGRPAGKVVENLRLLPIATRLAKLLDKPVTALNDCIGEQVEKAVSNLESGGVVLLENLRFHPEEEANDPDFARRLANLADIYVNDAFGASHRAHASVVGVAKYLPAVAGFLMYRELETLGKIMEKPRHPFAVVIGGAKVSGKLGVMENIISKADILLVGGGMVATFIKSQGYGVGNSLVERDKLDYVRQLTERAKTLGARIILPRDVIVAEKLETGSRTRTVPITGIPDGWLIADIGADAIKDFSEELKKCQTVVWNGPVGVFEIPEFAGGTRSLARVIASLKATTVIGGGSTAEAVVEMGLSDRMSHVSTGGGASLEFMEGKVLPGVAALQDK